MRSKFTSGKSVGKNQTVPISAKELTIGRLSPFKIGAQKARIGAEIDIIGLKGKSLFFGGNGKSSQSSISRNKNFKVPNLFSVHYDKK